MSKRKLTVDDKKSALLDYFHETKEVFQLKELEKMAPRTTGIAQQGIKDILQKLLDDGLVDTSKIGSSVFYWSYPSRTKNEKIGKLEALQKQVSDLQDQIEFSKQELAARSMMDNNPDTIEMEQKNEQLKVKHQTLLEELGHYDENDMPENWENMRQDVKSLYDAANRWTDNIFCVKSWCKKKLNCEDSLLNKQFRIPGDFDYIE